MLSNHVATGILLKGLNKFGMGKDLLKKLILEASPSWARNCAIISSGTSGLMNFLERLGSISQAGHNAPVRTPRGRSSYPRRRVHPPERVFDFIVDVFDRMVFTYTDQGNKLSMCQVKIARLL